MSYSVEIEGLSDLLGTLQDLPKSVQTAALRRVLRRAAAPVAEAAKALAPVDQDPASSPQRAPGTLRDSILVGTKLTKRQRRFVKREGKSYAEVYVGTADPAGVLQEFGTFKEPAQPFMGPAWDREQTGALAIIQTDLKGEIDKATARARRRAASLAAKG